MHVPPSIMKRKEYRAAMYYYNDLTDRIIYTYIQLKESFMNKKMRNNILFIADVSKLSTSNVH